MLCTAELYRFPRDLSRAFPVQTAAGSRIADFVIASAGRAKYHALFNDARVQKFMVETMLGGPYSEPYEWAEEVCR